MKKIALSQNLNPEQNSGQPQVIYIDGCKVTVRYSGQKNPVAVKNIRNTLIASGVVKKS